MNIPKLILAALCFVSLHGCLNATEIVKPFDLDNEVVCRVNTEAVSKRQVEERMEEIALKLYGYRRQLELGGQWNKENEKKWNDMYIPPFRDALKRVVRERLMLQYAKIEKTPVDERALQNEMKRTIERLKENGVFGGNGFSYGEVEKRVRERMLLDNYRYQFSSYLEFPTRPEIRKQYEENINQYQRKAGVKVRMIRIERFITSKLTGKQTVRENSFERAEELRQDIVTYGADFKEVARQHSDDEELRARGGLVVVQGKEGKSKDAYFLPEDFNPKLAEAIRGLKPGEVSKVFELQTSWAIAMLEDRREAGSIPLEEVFDDIYQQLMQAKTRKREDDWFRKALAKSLVVHVIDAVAKTLGVDFFFPDDKMEDVPAAIKKSDKENVPVK